ncbi:extracellular solute-binding protein [Psychromicrobium xiongbiense]|uniref:extracellular solute-binding protein n=1 Tax=Psychromicrobium xiongbiense TaxID=3051184 RepID=UPI002555FF43|nr:extracellular solute-binding protein [Psychromicrobium sp. YIM S02556]
MKLTHRKRGAAILAVAALASALAGCSTSADTGGGDKILTVSVDVQDRLTQIIKNFETANPGVKVKVTANADSYAEYMQTLIAAGTAPDVIRTFPGSGNTMGIHILAKAGVLTDLSGNSWAKNLTKQQVGLFGQNDKVYSVPLGATGIGVLWNDQAMASVGATPPKTYSELLNLCRTAKEKGKVAFALFQKGGNVVQSYSQVASLVYGKNPNFSKDQSTGSATFAGSGWQTAFEQQLELNKAGCFNDSVNGTDWPAASTLVGNGGALGIIAFSEISGLQATAPAKTTWTMSAMPTGDNPAGNYMAVADSTGFGINAKAKQPELAAKFIAYLATPEAQNAFANALGGAPAIPNDSFKPQNTQQEVVAKFKADNKVGPWPDQDWPGSSVQETLNEVVQELFAGKATPAQAAEKMDTAYKAELKK